MSGRGGQIAKVIVPHILIVVLFIAAHGIVAHGIAPVQARFLPEVTLFACLVYLPHGIIVLAVLFYGWPAVISLTIGNILAGVLFSSEAEQALKDGLLIITSFGSAFSVLLAFELLKMFGYDLYARSGARINWKMIVVVGAVASVFNSISHRVFFAGVIFRGDEWPVFFAVLLGDTIGLAVLMFILMYGFRWARIHRSPSNSGQ